MTEALQKSLANSKSARWFVLILVSFLMLCGYFITDVMAPLKPMLEEQFGWTSMEYGSFTGAYGWFNVVLLMLIISGIILDKMGVRFTGFMATGVMIAGVAIKYLAVASPDMAAQTVSIFGWEVKKQLLFASLGYAIFGVGVEAAGITISKIIVKWFKGKELAMAMGLEMACARIGTGLAIGLTPFLVEWTGSISAPILMGLALLIIGLVSFFVFAVMDKKYDKEIAQNDQQDTEEPFRVKDILSIASIRGFWYVALLCVLFYSAVFPFLKYASDLMVNTFGLEKELAGIIPSLLPFGTILLTPIFGSIYDRKGYGATIMMIGSVMLIFIHTLFALPLTTNWIYALVLIIALGIAFSLVPSAMWPSVPKIVPENQLGTAYAMIFWIQNWGLMGVPMLIGYVLDKYCALEGGGYDYTIPMLMFAALGVLSLVVSMLLKREDKIKGFGLEQPNIQK